MQRIVINVDWGGFGLSDDAMRRYAKIKGIRLIENVSDYGNVDFYIDEIDDENYFSCRDLERDDPVLVQVVEEMGEDSFGGYATLKIVEIPSDVEWIIRDYDGIEHIAEKHRTWP